VTSFGAGGKGVKRADAPGWAAREGCRVKGGLGVEAWGIWAVWASKKGCEKRGKRVNFAKNVGKLRRKGRKVPENGRKM